MKSATLSTLAAKTGLSKKQAGQFVEELVKLSYKEAKNSFTIPGLGKLVLVNRAARMGRNPATGETIRIKAKRSAKITPLKSFKDAVLSGKAPAAKKAPAKKAPAKKTAAKKAPAKKTVAKKAPAKKAPAKKTAAKKAPAKKTTAKKATRRR